MDEDIQLEKELEELKETHRRIDTDLQDLFQSPFQDQLRIMRLKREKLRLRDEIFRIQNMLWPDMPA
ncbi:MAG: DUF465 domain-containing protein [Rickettsiales bacterium]|nr:DUF465 domain-containing protein [Rickettsiales bacterium]|tara:strand:+ start:1037 stop:1237 length:201 start_codon:yes stop_codon:yes gene_type:complete